MYRKMIYVILLISVMAVSTPAQVPVVVFSDDFDTPHDYLARNVAGTGWDSYIGSGEGETVDALNSSMERAGQLYMASTNGWWSEPWETLGPFLYKVVEGDFIATVQVADYAGNTGALVYHNNCGLMARAFLEGNHDDAGPGEDWVSIDYFPIWNCGNFVRTANNNVRFENGHNGKAFNLDPYVQLERKGNTFHLRTSTDGVNWTEMIASPVTRDDFDGLPLQIGLHHATFSTTPGYVAWENFSIEKLLQLKAFDPVPDDGADNVTEPMLRWQSGETAAWHNVYLGTDPDALELVAHNTVGQTEYHHESGFTPGATYYWRVDEVEADGVTIQEGDLWSFTALALTASKPSPADSAQCVLIDADLSWTAGLAAASHDVYFGTDEAAVANATTDSPEFMGNQTETVYQLDGLENDMTYYWRVDEIKSDGATKYTGHLWSFRTIEYISVLDPHLVGWWTLDGSCDGLVVDSSGYNNHGVLGGNPQQIPGFDGEALQFDGRGDYVELDTGSLISSLTNSTFTIWADSLPGGPWQRIFDFSNGTDVYMCLIPRVWFMDPMRFAITTDGVAGEFQVTAPDSIPDGWHHVAVTIDADSSAIIIYLDGENIASASGAMLNPSSLGNTANNWLGRSHDPEDGYYMGSLDDFRIYDYVLSPDEILKAMKGNPMLAWNPTPINGEITDIREVESLEWLPGDEAVQHDVYLGTDRDAVAGADISTAGIYRGRRTATSYALTNLEWGRNYYWRIDEVNNDASISEGRIWSFTVADYLVVEDFEDYNDYPPNEVWNFWLDGYDDPSNGSTAGYPDPDFNAGEHYLEINIIHSGAQSLPLFYDNSVSISEITKTLNEDWTEQGVGLLTLFYYGDAANDAEQMYVALDGDAVVQNDDQNAALVTEWTRWDIPLQEFVDQGINLTNVRSITIGFGNKANPVAGGEGVVFFDDIRLYRP
jgi:hypothetical protein